MSKPEALSGSLRDGQGGHAALSGLSVDLEELLVRGPSDLNKEAQTAFSFCPTLHATVLSSVRGHILASAALMKLGSSGLCCPVFLPLRA